MANVPLRVINRSQITVLHGPTLDISFLANAVDQVNEKLRRLRERTESMELNVFQVIDFRMLSGLIGETLVSELSKSHPHLERNPNIDGYPDLLNAMLPEHKYDIARWAASELSAFIKYPYGGIEIKNTFGTKKQQLDLPPGKPRIGKINKKLDWKAHHRYTNNLLALLSDYVDECPQIVAAMFSDTLVESDWKEKQNPAAGSTMTSFSVVERSGYDKLRSGLRLCRDDPRYLSFFEL